MLNCLTLDEIARILSPRCNKQTHFLIMSDLAGLQICRVSEFLRDPNSNGGAQIAPCSTHVMFRWFRLLHLHADDETTSLVIIAGMAKLDAVSTLGEY